MQPYSSADTATVWKNSCFILSERSDFLMVDNLLIDHALPVHMLTSLLVNKLLLPRCISKKGYYIEKVRKLKKAIYIVLTEQVH